nr:hypothetical protein [Candidatus Sigynarchaeota archaeon]
MFVQLPPNESLFSLLGIDNVMQFFELVLMAIVVNYFLYYGVNFFKKSRDRSSFEIERKLNVGYGFFFIGLAFGYGTYVADRIGRFYTQTSTDDGRLFFRDTEYGIVSAINRDYILLTFIGLGIGLIFLAFVVEKYILNRKVILAWITTAGFVFSIALRPIELAFYPVAPDVVEYLGYIIYAILLLVLVLLLVLYGTIAKNAPPRSDLWNRSISFIVGILLMVVMLMVGNNQFSRADDFIGENLLGPIITLAALFIMNYGFSKKKD